MTNCVLCGKSMGSENGMMGDDLVHFQCYIGKNNEYGCEAGTVGPKKIIEKQDDQENAPWPCK